MASAQDVIAAGGQHSCAVVYGRLQCWGSNGGGRLGNGTTTASTVPTPVATLDGTVPAAAAGGYHTCAIVDEGLMCWGYNGYGQLGDETTDNATTPVAVSGLDSGVMAVATGALHTCAVVGGGLKCWGYNGDGQLGTGNTDSSATPVGVFDPGSGVTAVAAGLYHTCAVVSSEVFCWGSNGNGQLGTGNQQESLTPILVSGPINNAVGVAAGYAHSCAVLDTGGVSCWGYNSSGQLGNDSFNFSLVPVTVYAHSLDLPPQPIALSGGTAITAGAYHTCATTSSGAYCWGYNMSGQLGVGSTVDSGFARPVSGLGAEVTAVAAGSTHTCAVASGEVLCWGSDELGQLGAAGASPYVAVPDVPMPGAFNGVSAGGLHGCAVSAGGVYCWGSNRYGQLGTGTFINYSMPQPVSGLDLGFVAAAAGGSHSCAMNSSSEVTCWGNNYFGQLGNGTFAPSPTPVGVGGQNDDAVNIATGQLHTCMVRSGGDVQCWGYNDYGQLGDGTSGSASPQPVTVTVAFPWPTPLSGATAVTAGGYHTCAVANDAAYCWGKNESGQLGNDSATGSLRAVQVSGLGAGSAVAMVSAGLYHTCAIVNDGVQCWGHNAYGQLGNGTDDYSTTPVPVSGLEIGVSSVASGSYHTCAVIGDGVQCWGSNDYGQLGDGSFAFSNVPVTALPLGSGVTAVTAGDDYTCATGTTGGENTTWCWGNGMYGRLANGEDGYMDVPVHVLDRIFVHGFDSN